MPFGQTDYIKIARLRTGIENMHDRALEQEVRMAKLRVDAMQRDKLRQEEEGIANVVNQFSTDVMGNQDPNTVNRNIISAKAKLLGYGQRGYQAAGALDQFKPTQPKYTTVKTPTGYRNIVQGEGDFPEGATPISEISEMPRLFPVIEAATGRARIATQEEVNTGDYRLPAEFTSERTVKAQEKKQKIDLSDEEVDRLKKEETKLRSDITALQSKEGGLLGGKAKASSKEARRTKFLQLIEIKKQLGEDFSSDKKNAKTLEGEIASLGVKKTEPAQVKTEKTVVKKGYNPATNQTQFIYSDGTSEIVDGKK